jgi:hypothetical protein
MTSESADKLDIQDVDTTTLLPLGVSSEDDYDDDLDDYADEDLLQDNVGLVVSTERLAFLSTSLNKTDNNNIKRLSETKDGTSDNNNDSEENDPEYNENNPEYNENNPEYNENNPE